MKKTIRIPFIYTISQRGRPLLCIQENKYRKERDGTNGTEYWRCMRMRCRGRITMKNKNIVKINKHTH